MAFPRDAADNWRQAACQPGTRDGDTSEKLTPPCRLEHDLVIQAQPQLGHPAKVALHLDCSQNLAPDDAAVRVDEQVDALYDIEEDFILPVPDPF